MVGLGKVQKHPQKLAGHPLLPAVRPDGHIGDIPLVQHRLQTGVARHLAVIIQRHQKGGKVVVQFLCQHVPAPGRGEADPFQLRHLVQMVRRHGHDADVQSLFFQPVAAPVGLRRQGDGQVSHLLHFLLQQLRRRCRLALRALHDQFIVDL